MALIEKEEPRVKFGCSNPRRGLSRREMLLKLASNEERCRRGSRTTLGADGAHSGGCGRPVFRPSRLAHSFPFPTQTHSARALPSLQASLRDISAPLHAAESRAPRRRGWPRRACPASCRRCRCARRPWRRA
eukprot:3397887-Pleurochrysis_carterae.AAC.2